MLICSASRKTKSRLTCKRLTKLKRVSQRPQHLVRTTGGELVGKVAKKGFDKVGDLIGGLGGGLKQVYVTYVQRIKGSRYGYFFRLVHSFKCSLAYFSTAFFWSVKEAS